MPKFYQKEEYHGFDPKENWQMVPLNGARSVILEDGANLKVRLKDPKTWKDLSSSVASVNETSSAGQYRREFRIEGYQSKEGEELHAVLHAEDSSNSARNVSLNITILPLKITKLDFHRLVDNKGRYAKTNPSEYPQMVTEANYLLYTQTNVSLWKKDAADLYIDYDFGDEIDADELISELKKFAWPGTYPSIIIVWKFDKKGKGYESGNEFAFTKPPFILMEDPTPYAKDEPPWDVPMVLAHEIGHYFIDKIHHDYYENLMYYSYPHGRLLEKSQIIKFNRNEVAWW